MLDQIVVNDIRATGCYGVTAEERATPQTLIIDLELEADLRQASSSDELEHTIDYSLIHKNVVNIVAANEFKLLESLGQKLIENILFDKRIKSVCVKIAKPKKLDGATPAVILRRGNL